MYSRSTRNNFSDLVVWLWVWHSTWKSVFSSREPALPGELLICLNLLWLDRAQPRSAQGSPSLPKRMIFWKISKQPKPPPPVLFLEEQILQIFGDTLMFSRCSTVSRSNIACLIGECSIFKKSEYRYLLSTTRHTYSLRLVAPLTGDLGLTYIIAEL